MANGILDFLGGGNPVQTTETTNQQPRPIFRAQGGLLNSLIGQFSSGGGEFGFGSAAKQGNETLMGMLSRSGISPESGQAQGLLAKLLGQSAVVDDQNRRQYGMGLLNSSPASYSPGSTSTAQVTGASPFGNLLGTGTDIGLAKLLGLL